MFFIIGLFGCTNQIDDQNIIPDGATCILSPDIVGKIIDIDTSNAIRVLVDSTTDGIKGQIWVAIDIDTVFVNEDKDTNIENIDVTQYFEIGNVVAVLSDGVIMESYPMQTTAISVYDSLK